MVEYAAVHLRVNPQAIPRLRAAFEAAVARLGPEVAKLGRVGHIRGAWMGDPKSEEVRVAYNEKVMDAVDGPYQALVLYVKELSRVVEQLYALEQDYQRTDLQSADMFSGGVL